MSPVKFVAYYRVSTVRQGASGLGLEAQREAVGRFLNGGEWELVGEFTEIETGKGSDALAARPQLRAALDICRTQGATLLIAKLDRLARSVHFVSGLMEAGRAKGVKVKGVKFVAVDMPEANDLTIHIMAAFAEHEAARISQRTKDALAIAKKRGVILGAAGPKNLRPTLDQRQAVANTFAKKLNGVIAGCRARRMSQREIVAELNTLGLVTPRGGVWTLVQLQRVMGRLLMLQESTNSIALPMPL